MSITPNTPTTPAASADKKALTAAEAAKQVRRTVIEMVDGKTADGQGAKVPKEKWVPISASEVFDFAERDGVVVVVTRDGQKLSSELA